MIRKSVALNEASATVLALVFLGLMLIVAQKTFAQVDTTSFDTNTIVNETVATWSNNTYRALTYPWATSVTSIANTSNTIGSGNYTLLANESASSVRMLYGNGANGYNASTYYVTYSYNYRTSEYYMSRNASGGMDNLTTQMPLIGLIIGLGIVIRILWGSFGGMFSSGGQAGQGL